MSIRRPFAIRFAANMIEAVKRFAAEDGVTPSEWIRRIVEKELKNPMRPVDFRQYPQSQTTASGGPVEVKWDIYPAGAGTWTQ